MKRILSLLLACILAIPPLSGCTPVSAIELTAPAVTVTPAASAEVDQALSAFSLSLLQGVREKREGERDPVLLSPLSVALALSMAANGAAGETLAQFESVLGGGVPLDELNSALALLVEDYQTLGGSTQCSIANSLWCDPEGQIREDFVGKCRGIFDAQVFQAQLSDPSIVSSLNSWVSDHTNKMIPTIVSEPFPEYSAALLVNALYLKNTWASKFDPYSTREREFTHVDGQTSAMDFLSDSHRQYPYIQGEGVQGAILPYDDGRLAFFALLPDGELGEWLYGLEGDALARLLAGAQEDTLFLRLSLPKFEQACRTELKDVLSNLGLDAAFELGRADFSLLGDNPYGYFLSQVVHAAKIEVNEEGTEAAAATVADMGGGAEPPPEGITLIFDRPFLYGIADLETGVPLFLGTFE